MSRTLSANEPPGVCQACDKDYHSRIGGTHKRRPLNWDSRPDVVAKEKAIADKLADDSKRADEKVAIDAAKADKAAFIAEEQRKAKEIADAGKAEKKKVGVLVVLLFAAILLAVLVGVTGRRLGVSTLHSTWCALVSTRCALVSTWCALVSTWWCQASWYACARTHAGRPRPKCVGISCVPHVLYSHSRFKAGKWLWLCLASDSNSRPCLLSNELDSNLPA